MITETIYPIAECCLSIASLETRKHYNDELVRPGNYFLPNSTSTHSSTTVYFLTFWLRALKRGYEGALSKFFS